MCVPWAVVTVVVMFGLQGGLKSTLRYVRRLGYPAGAITKSTRIHLSHKLNLEGCSGAGSQQAN